MSTLELKEAVDKLSAEDRAWLTRYVASLNRINEPVFAAEVARRHHAMTAGQSVSREEVLALDAQLRAEGR